MLYIAIGDSTILDTTLVWVGFHLIETIRYLDAIRSRDGT
jgi:hypothetical protein